MTLGATWAKPLRLMIRSKELFFFFFFFGLLRGGGGSHFSTSLLERKEEEESFQAFFRRSTEFRQSEFVKTRSKVHRLDEGYTHIHKKKEGFHQKSKGDFMKLKISG